MPPEEKSGLKFTNTEEQVLKDKGYELKTKIGQGGYAKVYRGKFQRGDGKIMEIACKIIEISRAPKKFLIKFLPRELQILSKINHPYIINVHSVFYRSGRFYMFMRIAEKGDLLTYILKNGAIKENRVRTWTRQIALALQYLHALLICHRDIKCENILLTAQNNCKLSDFGFARYVFSSERETILSETFCGSLSYAPPEILHGLPYCPIKADIWSLGVVMYTMINKSVPFEGKNAKAVYKSQMSKNYKFRSKYEGVISNELKSLLSKIFEPDSTKRASLDQVIKSSWIAMDPKLTRLSLYEHNALLAAYEEAKAYKHEEKRKALTNNIDVKKLMHRQNSVAFIKQYDQAGFDLQLIRSNINEERLSS